ncbi:unnamed protein product, partial [Meganyctiphanes norvegica]
MSSSGHMEYLKVDWHHPDTTVFPLRTQNNVTVYDLSQPAGFYGGYYKLPWASNFTYGFTFDFEHNFDPRRVTGRWKNNWWTGFIWVAAYLFIIHYGKHVMRDRPRYELRRILAVWNIVLATFSTMGALRMTPELIYLLQNFGFSFSVCISGKPLLLGHNKGFWHISKSYWKIPGVIYLVMVRAPLAFIDYPGYHHVTVLLYAWYSYSDYIATARWFVCMNYLVHSAMYSYYALKAMKIKVPRWIAMTITTAQLAQMVMGSAVNIWAYQVKQAGNECHVSYDNIKVSLLMYISYFVLFAQFFRRAYVSAPKKAFGSEKATNGYLANGKIEGKGKVE